MTNLFKKGQIPWNKGKKFKHSGSFKKGHADLVPAISRKKAAKKNSGEAHPLWKGTSVGYMALHSWVTRNYGSPPRCEKCNRYSTDNKKIHWANISKKYKRERSDWKRLCVKCHFIYDKHPYHVNK